MSSSQIQHVTDDSFEPEVLKSDVPVLVDYWAEWCGPCKKLGPTVDALAADYAGKVTVGKLNVDENPSVPGRFMIRGIPTLLLFKNGQLEETMVGLASKEDIARLIEKHI